MIRKFAHCLAAGILLAAICASAQSTVTTSGGSTGSVPLFTGSATLGNSAIAQNGGNVGIGTTDPTYALDVNTGNSNTGRFYSNNTINGTLLDIQSGGNQSGGNNDAGIRYFYAGTGWTTGYNHANNNFVIASGLFTPSQISTNYMFNITQSGNVGIGTTTPGAKLEVNGNIKLTAGSSGSITFPDGTVQSTAYSNSDVRCEICSTIDIQRISWVCYSNPNIST